MSTKKLVHAKSPKKTEVFKVQKFKDKGDYIESMLTEFKKSTDTLDLTNCELNDEEILQIIEKATQIKKIKCLKLSKNKLTNEGLKAIVPLIYYSINVNLSHNSLTEDALDELIRKRQKLPNLRIINVASNKLNERKVKSKVQVLKKLGIIITL